MYYIGTLIFLKKKLRRVIMRLKTTGLRQALFDIGIFSFVINALMLVMPLYLLQVYDRVLTSNRTETLIYLSLIAVFGFVCLGLFEALRSVYAVRIANRFDIENAKPAFLAGLASPRAAEGDVQPLRDLATVQKLISSKLAFLLFDLPFVPLFIFILFFIHPLLFWLTIAGVVVLVLIALANQWAVSRKMRVTNGNQLAAMNAAQFVTRNADSVRALGMTDHAVGQWASIHLPSVDGADWTGRVNAMFSGASRAVRMILQIAILGVGAWLVLRGEMTAGMIFASSIISGRGLQPIDQLIGSWPQLVDARQTYQRLNAALDDVKEVRGFDPVPVLKGAIQVENLVYRLPFAGQNDAPIIKAISFAVEPGRCMVIVGPNGAGKSTLLRLMSGALPVSLGFIRFDGADVKSYSPDELGKQIGYLGQNIELLPGTLFQNIARFDPNATEEAVIKAAKLANVHDEISARPQGYQTIVGAQGYKPSGGHVQRLGLARALYGDPRLVFLDEPNANLDEQGHQSLVNTLVLLKQAGVTIIMVTQRDEILPIADEIMVFDRGLIVERDSGDKILQKYRPQLFAKMMQERNAAVLRKKAGLDGAQPTSPRPHAANGDTEAGAGQRSPFADYGPGLRRVNAAPSPEAGTPKAKKADGEK